MNQISEQAFLDELEKISAALSAPLAHRVIGGLETALSKLPKGFTNWVEKVKMRPTTFGENMQMGNKIKPIIKTSSLAAVIKKGVEAAGSASNAGKNTEFIGKTMTGAFRNKSKIREQVRKQIMEKHFPNGAKSVEEGEKMTQMINDAVKQKDNKVSDILGKVTAGATAAGGLYSVSKPAIEALSRRSSRVKADAMRNRILAGIGIGGAGALGGTMLANKLSKPKQEAVYYGV